MVSSAVPVEMRTSGSAMMGISIGPVSLGNYLGEIIWGWVCFSEGENCAIIATMAIKPKYVWERQSKESVKNVDREKVRVVGEYV